MENPSVPKLSWKVWLLVWLVPVMQVMYNEYQEAKHLSLSWIGGKWTRRPKSHGICTESGGFKSIVIFQGGCQVQAGKLLVECLCFQSLGGAMDVPKVLSKYNLVVLIFYDLTCLSCRLLCCMSVSEVDQPLRFGVSLGWNLRKYIGLFFIFNA